MSDPQARLDELISKVRERDYRLTPQRLAILKILAASEGHPSAERIFDQMKTEFPTTSLATVYKTIAMLKEMDQVLELDFGSGGNRYDGNRPYSHAHLICLECGGIVDAGLDVLDTLPQQIATRTGYQLVSHRFDIYGICSHCRSQRG
jgi:Fur family peroxide stress response transcriptional regulator